MSERATIVTVIMGVLGITACVFFMSQCQLKVEEDWNQINYGQKGK